MARIAIGTLLVLFGVVGGFIPVLQGWIFVIAGLSVMAPESTTAQRFLDRVKQRFQRQR